MCGRCSSYKIILLFSLLTIGGWSVSVQGNAGEKLCHITSFSSSSPICLWDRLDLVIGGLDLVFY